MNHIHFQKQVRELYRLVKNFETMFPGRLFTPDGHMVGSIGECLVAEAYDLKLMPPSNQGFDATTQEGKEVEIKATQGERVAFRSCPQHTIIIKLMKDGTFEECYNGPGDLIWKEFENRTLPKNGQFQISISKVKTLNKSIKSNLKIQRKNT